MGRVTDTKPVDSERTVARSQGYVDITVIVIVIVEIPVRLVEANAMGQDLDCAAAATVWLAILRRDIVGTLKCLITLEKLRSIVLPELVQSICERANVKVAFDWHFFELSLSRGDGSLNHKG